MAAGPRLTCIHIATFLIGNHGRRDTSQKANMTTTMVSYKGSS